MSLQENVDKIWARFDEDGSGTLNKEDTLPFYKELIANRPDLGTEADYDTWFAKIDSDSDGTISKVEMHDYLHSVEYTHTH